MAYGYNAAAQPDYHQYHASPHQQQPQQAQYGRTNGYQQGWDANNHNAGYGTDPYAQDDPASRKDLHYTIYGGQKGVDGGAYDLGNPYGNQTMHDSAYGSTSSDPYANSHAHQQHQQPLEPFPGHSAPHPGQPLQPFPSQSSPALQRSMTYDNPFPSGSGPLPDNSYHQHQQGGYGNGYGAPAPNPYEIQRPGTAPGYGNHAPQAQGYAPPPAFAVESDSQEMPNFRNATKTPPVASPTDTSFPLHTDAIPPRQPQGSYTQNGLAVPSQNAQGGSNGRKNVVSTYGEEHIEYYTRAHTADPYNDPYAQPPPGRGAPPGRGGPRGRGGPPGGMSRGRGGLPPRGPDGRPLPDRSRGPPPPGAKGAPPPGWDPRRGPPPRGRGGPPGSRGGPPRGGGPPRDGRDPRDPRDPRSKSRGPDGRRRDERDRRGPGDVPPRPSTAPGRRPDEANRPRQGRPSAPGERPPPVRPGLQQQDSSRSQPDRPPPVRQYDTQATTADAKPGPQAEKRKSAPITQDELSRLRGQAQSMRNDNAAQMALARGLVKASKTLADEGGRADPATKSANTRRYQSEAAEIVQRLSSAGYADGMFYHADCLGTGALGIPNDPKEAFGLYQAAAKMNHGEAAYRTAVCCEIGPQDGGGTVQDHNKAMQWYRHSAQLGNGPAMFKLGMISLRGLLGQAKNIQEGGRWLEQASDKADEENPHAVHELAILCEQSENPGAVPKDDTRALQLFTRGAKLGYRASQYRLGQAWEYGMLGCPVDARNSIIWYTRAAAQSERNSELALSGWYLTGAEGILDHSDTEAYLWARKAASNMPPLPKALFALGYYTEVGIGCPRSLEEAKKWYSKAANMGFTKARQRLDELNRGGANVQKTRERLSRSNQKQHEAECSVM